MIADFNVVLSGLMTLRILSPVVKTTGYTIQPLSGFSTCSHAPRGNGAVDALRPLRWNHGVRPFSSYEHNRSPDQNVEISKVSPVKERTGLQ